MPGPSCSEERNDVTAQKVFRSIRTSCAVFIKDVGNGLLEVSHNSLALVGLAVVAVVVFASGRADVRYQAEQVALGWLLERQEARAEVSDNTLMGASEPDAVSRATAIDPRDLNRQQAAVAQWLSRRYKVAPEPISRLVQEAWHVGQKAGVEPTLILAIMAVESSFNPFAQSSVGAQGLMQVMTRVHDDKYEAFGGVLAAFDPVTNLRVGVQVLKECIARAGGLEAGLKFYVGAANLTDDGGYAGKVLREQAHLRQVASGKPVAVNAPRAAAPLRTSVSPAPAVPAATPAKPDATKVADSEQVALLR